MEIERKFLAGDLHFDLDCFRCINIEQSYISTNPTIRLRKSDNSYILTVKGSGLISREEFELSLTEKQYFNLYKKIETSPVIKKRFIVPLEDNLTAEVDVYEGNLKGLKTIEVEFEDLKKCESFVPPDWFGKDISMDNRYKNTNLSLLGVPVI